MEMLKFEKGEQKVNSSMRALHSHPYYEIYFLVEGERSFFLSNAMYTLSERSLIVIPPHTMHMTQGGPYMRYNLYVLPSELDDFSLNTLDRMALKIFKVTERESELLIRVIRKGITDSDFLDKFESDRVKAALNAYILFLSDLKAEEDMAERRRLAVEKCVPESYLKIVKYLNDNCNEKITLKLLSEKFFIPQTTLVNNFKRYFSCSPIDFLLNIKITKSEKLLLSSDYSIEVISELCGFSSANYYGTIFKKKNSVSPQKYRKEFSDKIVK